MGRALDRRGFLIHYWHQCWRLAKVGPSSCHAYPRATLMMSESDQLAAPVEGSASRLLRGGIRTIISQAVACLTYCRLRNGGRDGACGRSWLRGLFREPAPSTPLPPGPCRRGSQGGPKERRRVEPPSSILRKYPTPVRHR